MDGCRGKKAGEGSGWGKRDLSRWRQLGRGRWLIRGARGLRGCVVCAFPFWGGFADGEGKNRRQSDEKRRAILEGESEPVWQGKCGSVSGGRFGVRIQGSQQRRFSIGCSLPRPAHHSVSRRGGSGQAVQLVASKLSQVVSRHTLSSRYSLVIIRHSSPLLGRSQLATSCPSS